MSAAATSFLSPNFAPLPYALDALEPVISGRTLSFHHDKHHRTYVETLSKLIVGTESADLSLDQIVTTTAGRPDLVSIFNNAAQAWNHDFYWNCLKPKGGGEPTFTLRKKMEAAFGGVEACKKELANSAMTQFGSGWAWLVLEGNVLKVTKTGNANNPLTLGVTPLVTIDVWEHAYYLDYQNKRRRYDLISTCGAPSFACGTCQWAFVRPDRRWPVTVGSP